MYFRLLGQQLSYCMQRTTRFECSNETRLQANAVGTAGIGYGQLVDTFTSERVYS
jgi:hypothetical protein